MTNPDYVHPVTSQWQRVLNGHEVPDLTDQHELPHPVPVRAHVVWARDGEETKDARVSATCRVRGQVPLVLVHWAGAEPRSQILGAWLAESDVDRSETRARGSTSGP